MNYFNLFLIVVFFFVCCCCQSDRDRLIGTWCLQSITMDGVTETMRGGEYMCYVLRSTDSFNLEWNTRNSIWENTKGGWHVEHDSLIIGDDSFFIQSLTSDRLVLFTKKKGKSGALFFTKE